MLSKTFQSRMGSRENQMWWHWNLLYRLQWDTREEHCRNTICKNGRSSMLSFITHNCKGMVGVSCDALHKGGIFGWLQIGGTRNPFISLFLIGDAQIPEIRRDAELQELCISKKCASIFRFSSSFITSWVSVQCTDAKINTQWVPSIRRLAS